MPICLRLERQAVRQPFSRAEASAGSSNAMRIARMAMTTSSSMSVKARQTEGEGDARATQRRRIRRGAQSSPAEPRGVEAFIMTESSNAALRQLVRLIITAVNVRRQVEEWHSAGEVGQGAEAGPVGDRQGEVCGGQNLEAQPRLALHGEAKLAVRHAGVGQGWQDRFGQPCVIHIPIPVGLVKPNRGGNLDTDVLPS